MSPIELLVGPWLTAFGAARHALLAGCSFSKRISPDERELAADEEAAAAVAATHGRIVVYVAVLSGEHHALRVNLDETVSDVKRRVHGALGEPAWKQTLSFGGATLESGSLDSHAVTAGSTLHLTLREEGVVPRSWRALG